jgi:hypothetical protein
MWDVGCGMWDVGCGMRDVEVGRLALCPARIGSGKLTSFRVMKELVWS